MSEQPAGGNGEKKVEATPGRRVGVRQMNGESILPCATNGRSDHIWWFGRVDGISAAGFRLILKQRFPAGTLLLVEFPGSASTVIPRRAVSVTEFASDEFGWVMNCKFLNPLSEAELRTLRAGCPA